MRMALMMMALMGLALGGCGETKRALGFSKRSPDEFKVVTNPPLTLPPDFTLRPPAPGENGPNYQDTATLGRQALGVNNIENGPLSSGEASLLHQAGIAKVQPGIRSTLIQEQGMDEKDDSLWERFKEGTLIVDKKAADKEKGDAIDPKAEASRLPETSPNLERRPEGFIHAPDEDGE